MAAAFGCSGPDAERAEAEATPGPSAPGPWFVDGARAGGLGFVHTSGATGQYYFAEITGSGCGLLDYDGDGDLDVYAVQAHALGGDAPEADIGRNRLYRNDLTIDADGTRRLRFTDVTDETGVGDPGYGMGVAVADYDNDGDLDLYVTNFGSNRLYRNDQDRGRAGFTDVSGSAIAPEDRWSTSAAFVDYDRDGFVDLFVANYVNFTVGENKACHSPSGRRDYCGPQAFDPVPDRLYHNNGDGTFSDVTADAGIDRSFGSGLGVVCADFNGDAWPDIYVANDGNANQLWINRGDGTFEDAALLAGAAYNADGRPEAGMGVSAADFDHDGDEDIFLSHLIGEHNTLLVNDGRGSFDDRTEDFELATASWTYTGFGTAWNDFDGDGFLDLFVANGGVKIVEEIAFDPDPYGNPNLLMVNVGPPRFAYGGAGQRGGSAVGLVETSRGAAFGDIDNDGDLDVLVANANGPLRLLRNEIGHRRGWLALRLVGTDSNRSAIGALVRIAGAGEGTRMRRVHADGSYCSANDLRVVFGLGDDHGDQDVIVTWPSGLTETYRGLPAGRLSELREGSGEAMP
ncbi:MAG: CRTAC1 family protein [Planctomycetota bacterium]|jgi:hypothetical protein